ncbi:MAG: amidohydrolase [Flavobacteriales bacterium]|nr:amidohydrolase [Flavobacteriales bacterium]MCB9448493.1 amidohydrolase [Flavobacteriales bacterium]
MKKLLFICACCAFATSTHAQSTDERVKQLAAQEESKVIAWRRDIHQHPELSNRETRTAALVAEHLKKLGIEVKTGVAKTGVVGILKGGKPGPVVALRADMDALPVTERVDVPFASKVKATFEGKEVGVMHACGHDTHVAILMGVAEVLASMKDELPGTVKFIFQPAEEGAPKGEEGGAKQMVAEGVMENPHVDAVFGLHISSGQEVNTLTYRSGGTMAGVNDFQIVVKGKQSHGAYPWNAADPIVASAQIINNLQAIISRNLNITQNAGVVTVGSIHGGVRSNIIPEQVEMLGTIRSLSASDEELLVRRVQEVATKTAESAGVTAEVKIPYSVRYPVTYNDPDLTAKMLPTMTRTAGAGNVNEIAAVTGAEDFSFYQEKAPGLYFFLGGMTKGMNPDDASDHHTPDFYIDESGMKLGVEVLVNLTLDYCKGMTN